MTPGDCIRSCLYLSKSIRERDMSMVPRVVVDVVDVVVDVDPLGRTIVVSFC